MIVGYWPGELFTNLEYAENVHWGGEIVDSHSFGRDTKTEMGSGHFPAEGFRKVNIIFGILKLWLATNSNRFKV